MLKYEKLLQKKQKQKEVKGKDQNIYRRRGRQKNNGK
jgi:hypothetical protein